jgi:hypothetical protein
MIGYVVNVHVGTLRPVPLRAFRRGMPFRATTLSGLRLPVLAANFVEEKL